MVRCSAWIHEEDAEKTNRFASAIMNYWHTLLLTSLQSTTLIPSPADPRVDLSFVLLAAVVYGGKALKHNATMETAASSCSRGAPRYWSLWSNGRHVASPLHMPTYPAVLHFWPACSPVLFHGKRLPAWSPCMGNVAHLGLSCAGLGHSALGE